MKLLDTEEMRGLRNDPELERRYYCKRFDVFCKDVECKLREKWR